MSSNETTAKVKEIIYKGKEIIYNGGNSEKAILSFMDKAKSSYNYHFSVEVIKYRIFHVKEETFDIIDFSDHIISAIVFVNCTFNNCTFRNVRLYRCLFVDCQFNKCNFINASFDNTGFVRSINNQNQNIGFYSSVINHCTLNEVAISGILFSECTLTFNTISRSIIGAGRINYGNIVGFIKCGDFLNKINVLEDGMVTSGANIVNINFSAVTHFMVVHTYFGLSIKINAINNNSIHDCEFVYLYKDEPNQEELNQRSKAYGYYRHKYHTYNNHMTLTTFDTEGMHFDPNDISLNPSFDLPSGEFIGWKVVVDKQGVSHIIKLLIPSSAKRCTVAGIKCRCEYAKVLRIYNTLEKRDVSEVISKRFLGRLPEDDDHHPIEQFTEYRKGEIVRPDYYDENIYAECSHGIHFFTTLDRAVKFANTTILQLRNEDEFIKFLKNHFKIKE